MGITFSKKSNRRRIVEPLFTRSRQRYKGPRSSQSENIEMNSLILDLERVKIDLDSVETSILSITRDVVGNVKVITEAEKLTDGPLVEIDGVKFNLDKAGDPYGSNLEEVFISNLNTLAAKISRLESKVKRLENGI
jgi:hypothetical protein